MYIEMVNQCEMKYSRIIKQACHFDERKMTRTMTSTGLTYDIHLTLAFILLIHIRCDFFAARN